MESTGESDAATTAGRVYPIRTVASLTGINPITLRAWERRYSLIQPRRTEKGHRLYTQQDIERIQRVLTFLNQGISIGQVKPLLDQAPPPDLGGFQAAQSDEWQRYRSRMLEAIEQFDEPTLDNTYNEALSLYPVDLVLHRLATPLLEDLGSRWKERPAGIAEEHFFSTYLRNKLGALIHHSSLRGTGPRLLLSCLPSEQHEIGMLFFALAAISRGYRLIVLGANLPLDQIPFVLEQKACDAVVLSGSAKPARGLFDQHLPELMKAVRVPVFIGGMTAARHRAAAETTGAVPVGQEFPPAFKQIAGVLAGSRRS